MGGPSGESGGWAFRGIWWMGLQRDLVGGPSGRPCGWGLQEVLMGGSASGDLQEVHFQEADFEGGSSGGHRGLVFRGTSRVAPQGDLVGGPSGGPLGWIFRVVFRG